MDHDTLVAGFAKTNFPVRHHLTAEPLLELEAIGRLADSLPPKQVEHNLGAVPEILPGGEAPQVDLPPGEIARGIETNGCWMVLKRVETDDEYRALVGRCLADVIPQVEAREGGATRTEGFIFLSAPNSTTPVHFDPEHNMLLQIRGPKRFTVGEFGDAEIKRRELTRYYGGGHRNIDEMPAGARTYDLQPGDGVYVPPHAPHLVKTFDQLSISLSVTFYTKASERVGDLYSINARLRKARIPTAPPGDHPGSDRAKALLWSSIRRGSRLVRSRNEQ